MGLDIYAGTLTRYYTQNWKTAVQQFGEAHGIPVQIIRANPEEHPADEAEVLERVTEWRKHILNGLGITEPPLWNEDANQTPYYTDKPDWDGITALQLFVLAKMFGEPVPETISKNADLTEFPLYQVRQAYLKQHNEPVSILEGCGWWVPLDEPAIFSYVLPNFEEGLLATVGTLKRELNAINALSWNATPEKIASWRNTEGYPYDGTVQMNGDISIQEKHTVYDTVSLAKFAFSILWEAADFAMQHGVVVLYDF